MQYNVVVNRKVQILQRQTVTVEARNRDEAHRLAVQTANVEDRWLNVRQLGFDYETEVKR